MVASAHIFYADFLLLGVIGPLMPLKKRNTKSNKQTKTEAVFLAALGSDVTFDLFRII